MAAFFESQLKGHKGNFVNQQMICSDFHCRGTLNQKPTIESIFLLCKLFGRSMAVKWVAMTKKKNENENQILKKLIIVGFPLKIGRCLILLFLKIFTQIYLQGKVNKC